MKLLLMEVVLLATNPIINIIIPVLASGVDRLGLNFTSKILKTASVQDYGDNYEYGDYPDYRDDYEYESYRNYDLNPVKDQDQVRASVKNDGGGEGVGVGGRRGGLTASQFSGGQIFNIHYHYYKKFAINLDEEQDEKCADTGQDCSPRETCCKNRICENYTCAKCSGENASCATIKKCCHLDQKCMRDKCRDWCLKPWAIGCGSGTKPCCDPVYPCLNGVCRPRPGACQTSRNGDCNDQYPCCESFLRCIRGTCQAKRWNGLPSTTISFSFEPKQKVSVRSKSIEHVVKHGQ